MPDGDCGGTVVRGRPGRACSMEYPVMKLRDLMNVVACTLLVGCSGGEAARVKQVAQAFWDASKANDIALAKTFVSESSMFQMQEAKDDAPPGDVELGEVEVDGHVASVETVVSNLDDETPVDMEFETMLVRENGEWKVDMDRTTGSMMQGAFAAMAKAMGTAMTGMAEGMADAFKEGFREMADSLENGN